MATRSNVVLTAAANQIILYRHWDGYPEATGSDLWRELQPLALSHMRGEKPFLQAADYFQKTLIRLLSVRDEDSKNPRPDYEITDSIHGDIEYLYWINFDSYATDQERMITIGHRHLSIGTDQRTRDRIERDLSAAQRDGELSSLTQYADTLNPKLQAYNRRLAELAQAHPGNSFYSYDPVPELVFGGAA
jgi:hypothetical protein